MHQRIRHITRPGYTLIEVLIVVVILGVAGAVVVPRLMDPSSLSIQAGSRAIIADLLYAQNEAIAHQAPRRIIFDADLNRYWLEDGSGQKLPLTWRTGSGENLMDFHSDDRFKGIRLGMITLEPDSEGRPQPTAFLPTGKLTIEFDELGGPDRGGAVGLRAQTGTYVVTIGSMTGRVTVQAVDLP